MSGRLVISITTVVVTALMVAAAYELWVIPRYGGELKQLRMKEIYDRSDRTFVEKAKIRYAKKLGEPASDIMEGRYTTVMHIKGDVCVSLNLEPPGVGGVPTYCFDSKSSAVTWSDDNGE